MPGLTLHGSRSWAAPGAGRNKFLLVFLRGGYDAANLLVPTANTFYEESRPNIAIARPGRAQGALPLDADWGLHPALRDTILPLYQKGQAAFVPFRTATISSIPICSLASLLCIILIVTLPDGGKSVFGT